MVRLYSWIIAIFLMSACPAFAAEKTITIVADEWCPYNCVESAENPGYIVEIARAIFKKEGITVVYKVMPWSDAIERTRAGVYDAIISATYNDAPDFVFPEVPQGISPFTFWVRPETTWRYNGTQSLGDLRIGIIEDLSYGEVLDAYLAEHTHEFGNRITVTKADDAAAQNIEALMAGRFDTIVEDKNVVTYYFASRKQPLRIKAAGTPIDMDHMKDVYLHLAFGPKHPHARHYAKLMEKGMVAMRQSGELQAILNKYGVDEFYRHVGTPAGSGKAN